jgi:hypothetical protein
MEQEVVNIMMSLFDVEYNHKVYAKNIAEESEEKGRQEGGIISMVKSYKKFGASFSDTVKEVSAEFKLAQEEAETKVKEIWQKYLYEYYNRGEI